MKEKSVPSRIRRWNDGCGTEQAEDLAATYSHTGSTCTTIGNTAFDGRVRNGIGSVHSFMATKNRRERSRSLKTTYREDTQRDYTEFKSLLGKAIKPPDLLVSVR